MSLQPTYSLDDVAPIIGKSAYWLASQARRQVIPHLRIGREVRFTEAHVKEIIDAAEIRPQASPSALSGLTPRSAAHSRRLGRTA